GWAPGALNTYTGTYITVNQNCEMLSVSAFGLRMHKDSRKRKDSSERERERERERVWERGEESRGERGYQGDSTLLYLHYPTLCSCTDTNFINLSPQH